MTTTASDILYRVLYSVFRVRDLDRALHFYCTRPIRQTILTQMIRLGAGYGAFAFCALLPVSGQADQAHLTVTEVTAAIHMIEGPGGNIGVMVGADGTFLIDDQMADVVPDVLAHIKALGGSHPRFLLNTHFHFDHTGGNAVITNAQTLIISHENTRQHLVDGNEVPLFDLVVPAADAHSLPLVTFEDAMTFHINGDTLRAVHVPNAHTDSDVMIHFERSNVVHTGDVFFNGIYPVIDTHNGGSLSGTIAAVETLLDMTRSDTVFIPGHGPLAGQDDIKAYLSMLRHAQNELTAMKAQNKTVEEVVAARPMKHFDSNWSGGFFDTETWVRLTYGAMGS